MTRKCVGLMTAAGGLCLLALSTVTASADAVAFPDCAPLTCTDAFLVEIGGGVGVASTASDVNEPGDGLFASFRGAFDPNFIGGTAYFVEETRALSGDRIVSDTLTISFIEDPARPGTGIYHVQMFSDCDPTGCGLANIRDRTPGQFNEPGLPTDVSSAFFGRGGPTGSVFAQSAVGDETPVPLPAALPLFASGLGGFGLMGWWRRRRQAAQI